MTATKHLEKELDKHSKEELSALLTEIGMEPHAKKKVMVNRARYALGEGTITSVFGEPEFDPELEAQNQPKPKREKKVKAPKEPKPDLVQTLEWKDTPYANRRVWVLGATCTILKISADDQYFLVRKPDGTEKAGKVSSCRFKAVDDKYRDGYVKEELIRTESGGLSIHSGSLIARALLGTNSAEVGSVYKENGLKDLYETKVNSGRNKGMIRMDLGNILMARVRKGESVTVFGLADLELAAQRGDERGQKEAEAAKERKAQAAKARSEKAEQAKADKAAAKEAKKAEAAEKAEQKKAAKAEKKADKADAPKEPKAKAKKAKAA